MDCPALAQLPAGRLLLRDLNGDGVPDFVVATADGLHAFLNERAGTREVLSYLSSSTMAGPALLALGTIDLTGDSRTDLLASFARPPGELGVDLLAFVQDEQGAFRPQTPGAPSADLLKLPEAPYTGAFAVGQFGATRPPSVILLADETAATSASVVQTSLGRDAQRLAFPNVPEPIQEVFSLPTRRKEHFLAVVAGQNFYVLDLGHTPARLMQSRRLWFGGSPVGEPRPGSSRPQHFWYDVDRDGDLDFCESGETQLALHLNLDNLAFDEPQVLDVDVRSSAEAPFIQVGPGAGLVARAAPTQRAAAVYVLLPQ